MRSCTASRCALLVLSLLVALPATGQGAVILDLDVSTMGLPANTLSARATFTLQSPTVLIIELLNTSQAAPGGFTSADQLLTGISFDLGAAGQVAGDPVITGGSVVIGPGGMSLNFDNSPPLGPGADVSGEWGYGNNDGSGALLNVVSTNAAQVTRFPGANLDSTPGLDGPQGGICTNPPLVTLGGLGAVTPSVVITITLDKPLANLDFLANGAQAEFGSDADFREVPEPAALAVLVLGGPVLLLRRRR